MAVLKTAVRLAHRGFESLPLRHLMLTRTLGSRCAAEGLLVLGRDRSRGSQPHQGAMHEDRDLLDEGWVYSVGCGGSCSTHNPRPIPPEDRGVAGRNMAGRSPGVVEVPPGESWSRIRVSRGPFTPASTRTTSQASPAGTASTRRDSSAGRGRLTESGTAFGARNVPFLQMTEVVPQSSGGKRSPRRRSTSPIRPSVTTLSLYSAVRR